VPTADLTLHVRCLGTFSYRANGDWQSGPAFKRGREFLQYLSSYPRAALSRETLVEAFWPEVGLDAVRHRLHLAATGARAALRAVLPEIDAIRCVGNGYQWHPAIRINSDYEDLLGCCRDGTDAALKHGIALYAGEFCAGEVAEWMYALRARALHSYTTMLERLAEAAITRADYSAALNYALQLIEIDRGHEEATRLHDARVCRTRPTRRSAGDI
jgi:DNA-binding SARP family transcriptional activator